MVIACQESLKCFSKIWAILVGSVSILPVSGSYVEACLWLCIFIFKYFFVCFVCFLWCFIYQLLLLVTSNIVVFFVV